MSKGLEALKYFSTEIRCWYPDIIEYKKIIEKELKALEIVNKKRVNVHKFKWCVFKKYSVNHYNLNFCDEDEQFLNEQEYDLLKEVFCDDEMVRKCGYARTNIRK